MKNIKMLVTDLDKTLLRKDKTISEYTQGILKKCCDSEIVLVFATARPERATRQWQPDSPFCYVIANNGATITHRGSEMRNTIIAQDIQQSIIEEFINHDKVTEICVEAGACLYSNGVETSWDFPADTGWNLVYNDFHAPLTESICKISVECESAEAMSSILQGYPQLRVFPNNGEYWHQITHSSTSKINAITYLAQELCIKIEDVMAFGDDYNDVEMIKTCGVGVAVENAVAEAKKEADYICGTNDDDGVAKFIDKYLLSGKEEF